MTNRFSVRTALNRVSQEREKQLQTAGSESELDERSVLIVAFLVEGILLLLATIGLQLSSRSLVFEVVRDVGFYTTILGVLLAAALFILNCIFLLRPVRSVPALNQLYEFNRAYVVPLASILSFRGALIVSLLAGFGEELFFRAFLQPYLGISITGILFAALHFGKLARRYPLVFMLYFAMSCLFGWVYESTASIWTVSVAHATYDLVVLTYVRKNRHHFRDPE